MTCCYRLVALATAVAILGCGASDSGGTGGSADGGGGEGASDGAAVAFFDPSPLTVAPGQAVHLSVHTDPPGAYQVSFLLLGEALDASLDRSDAPTDGVGDAGVTLLAPSKAASFKVRAALRDPALGPEEGAQGSAEIVIEVSELGLGQLRIIPDYQGNREINQWHAAVIAQARCADFAPPGDPEGAEVVEAPPGDELVFDDAIVGPTLAVLVRSEHKVWGCVETTLSHAGESKVVTVPVLDRPLDLSSAALDVALILVDPSDDLELALRGADDLLVEAAFPASEDPGSVLLDAMATTLPTEVVGFFDDARGLDELDQAVADDLASRDVDLRRLLEGLLRAGRPLGASFLTGRLSSAEADANHALFHVESFAGLESARAGVPPDHLMTFVANPGDTVIVGAESGILFLPTRLVGALAEDAALAAAPDAAGFSAVLADAVGCTDVANVVGTLGDCDVACVEASCRLALGEVWARSLDTSAENADLGVFTVAFGGQGVVDAEAALIGLDPGADNSWVGELHAAGRSAGIGGIAIALQSEDGEAAGGPSGGVDDAGASSAGGVGVGGASGGVPSGAGGSGGAAR